MKIWPRSLRGRLILTVTLTMVVTQLVLLIGASQAFGRLQRAERAEQMARHIAFIKPIIEKQENVTLDVMMPGMERRFREGKFDPDSTGEPARGELERPPPSNPGGSPASAALGAELKAGGFPRFRPNRARASFMVTANAPPVIGDADLVLKMREIAPDVVQVVYQEKSHWTTGGPNQRYGIEAWTRLGGSEVVSGRASDGAVRYLKTVVDQPEDEHRPLGIFPLYELLLRGAIGALLALLITSWIAKPLARLAAAADDTLPTSALHQRDAKAGGRPIQVHQEPAEIAYALSAFERLRGRIGSMVIERTTMLTALAHDLRTPITRLMLRLEMSSDERLREDAMRDLTKMQTLIARTLDFLRSAEQGQHINHVDLRSAIEAALASLGANSVSNTVIQIDDNIKPTQVRANAWGLERMFANVLDNALKYGGHAHVHISSDDNHATVKITDGGHGVPEEALHRLKEPFYRVDAARNLDQGGAGLGMSIVDNLVRAYGGEWSIANGASALASTDGNAENGSSGLVVEIRLPLAKNSIPPT